MGTKIHILSFIIWLFCPVLLYAQKPTPGDCLGAIPICQSTYDEPDPYKYSDNGAFLNEIYKYEQCITDENNGVWYIFTVLKEGALRFTITPHNKFDDYDWVLFDLSVGNCSDLKTNPKPYMVSSNNYGSYNVNGETGANSAKVPVSQLGNCNGPGEDFGPPFNQDIIVKQSSTYVLYVSNWSQSKYGYKIDFSASSAEIYDNIGPRLDKVVNKILYTGHDTINVTFSENVDCKSVSKETFVVEGPIGDQKIKTVYNKVCADGGTNARQFSVIFEEPLWPGDHQITLIKQVNDACNNSAFFNSAPFYVEDIVFDSVKLFHDCTRNSNGRIDIFAHHPINPLQYSVDNGITFFPNLGKFTGLALGNYNLSVKSKGSYIKNIGVYKVEMPKITMKIDSFKIKNVTPCNGAGNGIITLFTGGGWPPWEYSIDAGKNYFSTNSFVKLSPGNYIPKIKDSLSCEVTSNTLKITEPKPVAFKVTSQNIDCYGNKTGSITIKASTDNPPAVFSIDNGLNFQSNETFSKLSANTYKILMKDKNECKADSQIVTLTEPSVFKLNLIDLLNVESRRDVSTGVIKVAVIGGAGGTEFHLNQTKKNSSGIFENLSVNNYLVWALDANFCSTDTLKLTIKKRPNISISLSFSPNSDGINDLWLIKNMESYPDAEVKVFDRYGKLLFYSLGYSQPWDGTYNGSPLPIGSYFYHLSFKDGSGNEVGYITIIR